MKILQLAQELKLARFGQLTVSIDGTKIGHHRSVTDLEKKPAPPAAETLRRSPVTRDSAASTDSTPRSARH